MVWPVRFFLANFIVHLRVYISVLVLSAGEQYSISLRTFLSCTWHWKTFLVIYLLPSFRLFQTKIRSLTSTICTPLRMARIKLISSFIAVLSLGVIRPWVEQFCYGLKYAYLIKYRPAYISTRLVVGCKTCVRFPVVMWVFQVCLPYCAAVLSGTWNVALWHLRLVPYLFLFSKSTGRLS